MLVRMRRQRRHLCVFSQQHISNRSIRERTKQPYVRQYELLPHKPSFIQVRRVYNFNPNSRSWKIPRGCPTIRWVVHSIKHDLYSAGLKTQLLPRWFFTHFLWKAFVYMNCRRSNPIFTSECIHLIAENVIMHVINKYLFYQRNT